MEQLSLDVVDIQLPSVPQQDAALSNQALAEKVHVPPPTCLRRVKRLRDAELIEQQIAIFTPFLKH
jgi:Lrp/AsnC family transcriptional regulator, leucine-responsive regulatory protein